MSRTIKWLGVLLVAQIVLLAWVRLSSRNDLASYQSSEKLIAAEPSDVDRVVIEEPKQDKLELVKTAGKWVIPSASNFPAASGKIEEFLKKLLEMQRSWPVAKTGVAATQLKVADDDFNKKVVLKKGDQELGTLYLGTSPGFRKVHARVGGQAPIYSIDFNAYEAPVKAADWYDKELLRFAEGDVERLEINSLVLERGDKGLTLAGLSEGEEVKAEEVQSLVRAVTGLTIEDMLGTAEKPEWKLSEPALTFNATVKNRGAVTYTAGGPIEDKYYVVKVSDLPYFFKINKTTIETLKGFNRDLLVKKAENKAEPTPAAQASATAPPAAVVSQSQ